MAGDATLSVHIDDHREVAELRWDGATELIVVEVPENDNDAMGTIEDHKKVKSELKIRKYCQI